MSTDEGLLKETVHLLAEVRRQAQFNDENVRTAVKAIETFIRREFKLTTPVWVDISIGEDSCVIFGWDTPSDDAEYGLVTGSRNDWRNPDGDMMVYGGQNQRLSGNDIWIQRFVFMRIEHLFHEIHKDVKRSLEIESSKDEEFRAQVVKIAKMLEPFSVLPLRLTT